MNRIISLHLDYVYFQSIRRMEGKPIISMSLRVAHPRTSQWKRQVTMVSSRVRSFILLLTSMRSVMINSFLADPSSGFSGNLGFPMPTNWAFDQISTISIGSDSSAIEIDNNIASGGDHGQSSVLHRPDLRDNDFPTIYKYELSSQLRDYESKVHSSKIGTRPIVEAMHTTLRYDAPITSILRLFGVRKALRQAVIFREYWNFNLLDIVQIFAATAIQEHN